MPTTSDPWQKRAAVTFGSASRCWEQLSSVLEPINMTDKQSQEEALKGNVVYSLRQWGGTLYPQPYARLEQYAHIGDRILSSADSDRDTGHSATLPALPAAANAVSACVFIYIVYEHQWVQD
jgi:hypothetical protein